MTLHSRYRIGSRVSFDYERRPLGRPCDEAWYILIAPPQKDAGLAAWLERIGAVETWSPTETCWRVMPQGKRRKVAYEKPIAPGYVFTLLDREPIWDVMQEMGGKRLRGVVGVDETPYRVPERVIAQMQKVPERIEVLRKKEQARRAAEIAKWAPVEGGRATLQDGPLKGFVVDVTRIHAGVAHFLLNGVKGSVATSAAKRLDP